MQYLFKNGDPVEVLEMIFGDKFDISNILEHFQAEQVAKRRRVAEANTLDHFQVERAMNRVAEARQSMAKAQQEYEEALKALIVVRSKLR